MTITVTPLNSADRDEWQRLYHGYAEYYQMPMTDDILETVWQWIFDPAQPFFALIATDESGQGIGLMHFREMVSPLRGAKIGFLDDLFVLPALRGSGVVEQLYEGLRAQARQQGWPFMRWMTAETNYRGRAVYDRIAEKTAWLTYQMKVDQL